MLNRWVLGGLAVTAVGAAVTFLQHQKAADAPAGVVVPAAAPEAPVGPPVTDVIDLALELELAPVRAEPFVPFD